jgi:hypothetical protein
MKLSSSELSRVKTSRSERISLALLLLIFTWFTWRGMTMFYSGDDMMNMYTAWILNPWRLAKAQLLFWIPVYRPLGGGIYRVFYSAFGFHPEPLYVFCWLLLVANVIVAYRFFKVISSTAAEALIALSLTLVHGNFQDLYLSAGTIYDRLWFLFTALGIGLYPKLRRNLNWRSFALICLLSILSMSSKESGVALPVLLLLYELIFYFPEAWKSGAIGNWLRSVAPLFVTLGVISLVFINRVKHTPELAMTPEYHPRASVTLWLTRVAEYFGILTYRHAHLTVATCAVLLVILAAMALALRNRAMIFGLAFFIVTITPVALIASRPGYVLYVPDLGLGLFFAALIATVARRIPVGRNAGRREYAAFIVITLAITWAHQRNWPPPYDRSYSPELRLTEQFRRDYPTLPANTRLLFVSDEFPHNGWDLAFNLRLLYHQPSIIVHRSNAPPDQQPDPRHPIEYDHVFAAADGHYTELDPRDIAESMRLHILRDYTVGREMDGAHRDFGAYIVSGVMEGDFGNATRWTTPHAKMKFDLYPAPALFTAKFWVPDFVAKTALRTLTVLVNGKEVGSLPLTKDGMNEISFPVSANLITFDGYTFVDMDVVNPYKDPGGTEFGVVLLRAGFTWQKSK